MLSKELITFIFRIINLSIVVSIVIYIFKRFVLENIKKQIAENKENLKRLEEKNIKLSQRSLQLDKEIINQEKLSEELLEKIKEWKINFDQMQNRNLLEIEKIKEKVEVKLKIKTEQLTFEELKKRSFLMAILEAQKKLKEEFELIEPKMNYQKKLIEVMKREI